MSKNEVYIVNHTQSDSRLGTSICSEQTKYLTIVSPGLPITVMRLEDCFAILPNFGIDDVIMKIPELDLIIAFDDSSYVKFGESSFLIGPSVVYRTDEWGNDIPITVRDIYRLQEKYTGSITTLWFDGIEIPALRLEGGIIHG